MQDKDGYKKQKDKCMKSFFSKFCNQKKKERNCMIILLLARNDSAQFIHFPANLIMNTVINIDNES